MVHAAFEGFPDLWWAASTMLTEEVSACLSNVVGELATPYPLWVEPIEVDDFYSFLPECPAAGSGEELSCLSPYTAINYFAHFPAYTTY